jgi:hypothetical protein
LQATRKKGQITSKIKPIAKQQIPHQKLKAEKQDGR